MTLPNSIATFRQHWTVRFIDTVTIATTTGRGTFNETTLQYDTPSTSEWYTGAALIRPFTSKGETNLFGEQLVTGKMYSVYLPHDALPPGEAFPLEARVTVTAALLEPALVDETMTVVSVDHDSYLTRNRLICRLDEGVGYAD